MTLRSQLRIRHALWLRAFAVAVALTVMSQSARAETTFTQRIIYELCTSSTNVIHLRVYDGNLPRLSGLMAVPVKATGKLPLVVFNPGEFERISYRIMEIGPPLTRRGYAVITPLYSTATTRYGSDQTPPPTNPRADRDRCRRIAEFAATRPFIDKERIAVAGIGSGGNMLVRIVLEGHPYKAAIVMSSGARLAPAPPSPIDRIDVPFLILTGDRGGVSHDRAITLSRALENANKRRRLIVYPGAEADLLSWNADKVAQDMVSWLDAVLKPTVVAKPG